MQTFAFRMLSASLTLGLAPILHAADQYEVDAGHSGVVFSVTHLNVSTFYGRFNDIEGAFTFDPADPGQMAVDVRVKAKKIDTNNNNRDKHLRSPDFFNTKQFPEIAFKSASTKALDSTRFEVAGELTLHGVTRPLTVTLIKTGEGPGMRGGHLMGFESTFKIKRSEFGMDFMLDKLSDEITITVFIEGARK